MYVEYRAMTPKVARYLSDHQPATPCLVLDVDRVAHNFGRLRQAMIEARLPLSIRPNPARRP